MPIYEVFEFRNGNRLRGGGSWASFAEALQNVRDDGEYVEGMAAFVETNLIVKSRSPSVRRNLKPHRVTHSMARLEREQPDTLFVAVVESAAFERMCREADEAWDRHEAEIHKRIAEVSTPQVREYLLEELPASWISRIRVRKAGRKAGCWVWQTASIVGPYRAAYLRCKGAIPDGALVRHRCDNRRCVNPNHLELGTAADNVHDMWRRQRANWPRRHPSGWEADFPPAVDGLQRL